MLTVAGLARWADYGVRHYQHHPQRQRDYFALKLPDSRAVLQRERHGTLLADVERQLELGLRAMWQDPAPLRAFAGGLDDAPTPAPWTTRGGDDDSICLPDAYETQCGVAGVDRYRMALAHLAGHRRWSRPLVADNLSPLQRLYVESLEDARIDHLVLRRYPGLRSKLLALHPNPAPDACDPQVASCLRHRLVVLSRALLEPYRGTPDPALQDCVAAFHALLNGSESSTEAMQTLALRHAARTRRQSDQLAQVHFADTVVSFRDDNRHLWHFIEAGDEEDSFVAPRTRGQTTEPGLPPRHYPEWDSASDTYRPDWVSVYEALQPSGDAARIDLLLEHHRPLARQLQQLLDQLKPQDRVRIRYQQEGSELDLDIAIRALIDWRAGAQPDPRILMSHKPDRRSIAVLVLLDLSQSLDDPVVGTDQTRLDLSRQAVALLGWAIDRLGIRLPSRDSTPTPGTTCATCTSRDSRSAGTRGRRPDSMPCRPAARPGWARHCATRRTTWARRPQTRNCCWYSPTDAPPMSMCPTTRPWCRTPARQCWNWRSAACTATASAWTRWPIPMCTTSSASTPPSSTVSSNCPSG